MSQHLESLSPRQPRIDPVTVQRSLRPHALAAGRAYANAGRVREITVSGDGRTITAQTNGSSRQPYRQRITLLPDRSGATVANGQCSCPVGVNCKHVAAVLITLADREAPPEAPPLAPPVPTLPPDVAVWLEALERGGTATSEEYPDKVRQRLFYVLDTRPAPRGVPTLHIACFTAPLRKDGSVGAAYPYEPRKVEAPAGYLRPSDRMILRRLQRVQQAWSDLSADDDPADLLRRVIATGRARWGRLEAPILAEGPPRAGRITWQLQPDGSQRAALQLDDGLTGFRLAGPWYVEPSIGLIGPVDLGVPAGIAEQLLAAPSIPAAAASSVAAALRQRLPALNVPVPAELGPPKQLKGPPTPHLLLTTGRLPAFPFGGARRLPGPPGTDLPLARLSFRYGPLLLPYAAAPPSAAEVQVHDGQLYRIARDRAGEQAVAARLGGIGFAPAGSVITAAGSGNAFFLEDDQAGTDWLSVMLDEIPALRASGWAIDTAADFPVRVVEADGDIAAEMHEGSGIDWLELHLGIMVDGQRVDLVPALLALLADRDGAGLIVDDDDEAPFLVPLLDGRLLSLPLGRVRPIVEAVIELFAGGGIDPGTGRIGFSRFDAAELALLEERSGIEWKGGEALRALGRQLRAAGGAIPPAAVPASFRGTLRPYQAEGVAWLQFLRAAGLGGVLADDMGLGKTVQTLAHLAVEQAEGRLDRPALIVCPTSLVPNWSLEAARFAPSLKVLPLHGPARRERFGEIAAHDLVLTTYPLLTRDHEVLTAQDWHAVILDEAQTIKNPNAETTQQALRLKAGQRLCLSGTPLQNHLGELWSLFDFLAPGFLGSARGFRARYRTPIEKHGDVARQESLARRVRPFLLRRTKEEVAQELPPRTDITERVEMEAGQRAIYESVRLAMHAKVQAAIAERGLARSGIIILDALLKLRQACCDPRLLKLKGARDGRAGSAKLERLMEMLQTMLEEGRRVLLFSQFTSMLALIEARLQAAGIGWLTLTGETTDRATPVRRFQAGEVPVFLISLKAGGVGLNLTAADTVIHYDPWWNPAVEDQATDRAHRIGQDKRVFVHRLITLGSIEEKMETLKERKRALVASVLDAEHGGALKLTEADVEELFGAMG
jgi:superfamily II DNA or RNA helicase